MANSRKPANGHYSLAKYRSEATGEPFVLDVDTDRTITIPRPTGGALMEIEEATSSSQVIRLLAGDSADELLELFAGEDFAVMTAISADMQQHFGLGEAGASRT